MSWGLPEEEMKETNLSSLYKQSWQTEEDFVTEFRDEYGDLYRINSKGDYHSLYSPAIETFNGTMVWLQNGKNHRLDGPAVEYPNGNKYWYYEGRLYGMLEGGYTQEQFLEDLRNEGKTASQKLAWGISQEDQIKDMLLESIDWNKVANLIELYYQELLQVDRHASYYDAIDLFLDYNLSSEDPTISYRHLQESYPEIDPVLWNKVFSDLLFQSIHLSSQKLSWGEEDFTNEYTNDFGTVVRKNDKGELHSLLSPALEFTNGHKEWYKNGIMHRFDGPAGDFSNTHKDWHYDGEFYGTSVRGYNQEKFEEDLRRKGKIASMKLSWGEEDFTKEYKDEYDDLVRRNAKGLLHSLYSPAIEFSEGDKYWYQNGKLHRLDGPAKEHPDGYKEWYYDDNWYGDARNDSRNGYTQEQFIEDLRKDGKIASVKQEKDELFICLWAPDDVYTKFPNVDDELHVTLIYRKDITSSPDLSESFLKSIGNICDEVGTVKCKATGIGTFNNDSKSDAVLINIVKGASLYEKLRSLVESIYGKWDIDYGYLPHMTLKYKGTGKVSLKKFKPFTWNVRHIGVRIGEDNYLVNMKTGEYKKTKKILSSLEDSSNTLESILPEDSNSFVNPKEDKDIRRVNNKRYDKITDIYDTSNSEISNRTDNPIIGIASQKLSWGEEDFTTEEVDLTSRSPETSGAIYRKNDKGQLHSLYSPAIEYSNGYKAWYQNGKFHRLDGPAEEYSDGDKEWWYENNYYGKSRNGYTQEQFLEDLRNEGKIASMKLSWEDFHTYVFTEPISKSVMSPSLDNSKEAQEELLKSKLEKTIRNNELGVKVNKVTFISEDRSDGGERFMSYRYYRYDISCSTQDLVKLAKAVRLYTELLPTFNVYTTNITEDGLPFDLEAAFDKYW